MISSTIQSALEPSTGYATVVAVAMTPIVLLSLAPKGNRGVVKRGELTCFTVRQSVLSFLFPLPFPSPCSGQQVVPPKCKRNAR